MLRRKVDFHIGISIILLTWVVCRLLILRLPCNHLPLLNQCRQRFRLFRTVNLPAVIPAINLHFLAIRSLELPGLAGCVPIVCQTIHIIGNLLPGYSNMLLIVHRNPLTDFFSV